MTRMRLQKTTVSILLFLLILVSITDTEIPDLCETVDDVYLRDGTKTNILGSMVPLTGHRGSSNRVYQCWRVMPESVRTDRLIRLTINKIITKPTEDGAAGNVKCTNQLNIMEGTQYVVNKSIAERCSVGQGIHVEHAATPTAVHSVEPFLFIRYFNKLADPPEIWMNLTVELETLPDSVADCQQVELATGQGTLITSERYPANFLRDTYQCWVVTNNEDSSQFEVYFEDFNLGSDTLLEAGPECYDKLHVFSWSDVDTSKIKLLYRMCSNVFKGHYIYLTEKSLMFRFTTNSIQQQGGFKIYVRSVAKAISSDLSMCINTPISSSGTAIHISSPNYPSNYENNMAMCWRIAIDENETKPGHRVSLHIKDLHLDPWWQVCGPYKPGSVLEDRVDLILEKNPTEANFSWCGSNQLSDLSIWSSTEPFFIRFRSNQMITGSGFSITLFPDSLACEEIFLAPPVFENITISSPTVNTDICRKITVRTAFDLDNSYDQDVSGDSYGMIISLSNIVLSETGNCQTDYLRIYDGPPSLHNLIYSMCGNDTTISESIYTLSHQVLIKVRSSKSNNINIAVKAALKGMVAVLSEEAVTDRKLCRMREFTANDGILPFKKLGYLGTLLPPRPDCETHFTREAGQKLQMKIEWSQTSFSPSVVGCDNRNVTILDTPSGLPIMHVCSDRIEGVITSYNNGFSLMAFAKTEEVLIPRFDRVERNKYGTVCIGVPMKDHDEKYIISSPNYPVAYPPNTDICWQAYLMESNKNKRIQFEFYSLYEFSHHDCYSNSTGYNDTITLSNDKGEILRHGSLCQLGNLISLTFCSETEYAKVRFTSDGERATKGFIGYFTIDSHKGCPSHHVTLSEDKNDSNNDDFFTLRNILLVCCGGALLLLLLSCLFYCCCCRKNKKQTEPHCMEVGTYRQGPPNDPPEYDDSDVKYY